MSFKHLENERKEIEEIQEAMREMDALGKLQNQFFFSLFYSHHTKIVSNQYLDARKEVEKKSKGTNNKIGYPKIALLADLKKLESS